MIEIVEYGAVEVVPLTHSYESNKLNINIQYQRIEINKMAMSVET